MNFQQLKSVREAVRCGYNLTEVVARGWPVRCEGDPDAVVGLPVAQIAPILRESLGGPA
jgi:predicted house-cleaning NTP pyrophosphatase (Maf/HAM1 superfamily)